MSLLFLRFHDDSFEGFDWSVFDSDASVSSKGWHSSNQSELDVLLSQYAMPVVLVIPQQYVYHTEFLLPEKASRQILASIEYQIEDQLAQDTEAQHYAIGPDTDNRIPIAVVEQSMMRDCLALQGKHGFRIAQIIPELFLCPWSQEAGQVSVFESHDSLLLRYGEFQGFKCKPQMLKSMLDLVNRQTPVTMVNYYLGDESAFEALKTKAYPASLLAPDRSPLNLENARTINLQQKQFQASSNWSRSFKLWRAVASVALILLIVTVSNRFLVLHQMETELAEVRASQYELVKDRVPERVAQSDNLKTELIRLLRDSSDGTQSVDFVSMLLDFSQAQAAFSSINIVKIGYQKQRLSIDISSRQLNDVEALQAALSARGLSAKLEKLSIKPELVSGQFVIEGGSNG